jgi:hypothetical protein
MTMMMTEMKGDCNENCLELTQQENNRAHDDDHLDILPPVLAFQGSRRLLELGGAFLESICNEKSREFETYLQRIGTIVQLRQLLITLEDLFDVHLKINEN